MSAWRTGGSARTLTLLAVLAALAANYASLVPLLRKDHGDFDALHLYFPLARGLLAGGIGFLADPRSIEAPLFSYLWPALLGVSLPAVKIANALLSGATLLAVFRSAWLMHSRLAGIGAAFLFAFSPTIRPHLATPITEGPYLLLTAVWFWGIAEWIVRGRRWALALAAGALCLAALTRATIFQWLVLCALAGAILAWRGPGEWRRRGREALVAHAAGLLPIAALIAKNMIVFGFAFYATGGGNALYLGNDPLTGGYDPSYVNLRYDVGAIARDQSQLTLESERLLRKAARLVLEEQDAASLAQRHLRKLAAFVFVTGAEVDAIQQRSWRIALIVAALVSLPWASRSPLAGILAAMLAYQLAVHAPVLYTHRYSVDALDLWLVLAAGVGIAQIARHGSPRRLAVATAAAALAVGFGAYLMIAGQRPMPDVLAAPRLRLWEAPRPFRLGGGVNDLDLDMEASPRFSPHTNHVVAIEAASGTSAGFGCDRLLVSFRPAGGTSFSQEVSFWLRPDGRARLYQAGGEPLHLAARGTLRLAARCGPDTYVTIHGATLFAALGASELRARLTGEPGTPGVER